MGVGEVNEDTVELEAAEVGRRSPQVHRQPESRRIVKTVPDETDTNATSLSSELIYSIDDVPPWTSIVIMGLQHFLTDFGSNVSTMFLLAPSLCISHDAVTTGEIIGTLFVVQGLITLLQTTFGVRLPIIQGTTFAFVVPTIAVLNQRGTCPPAPTVNATEDEIRDAEDEWLARMREIQGSIMVGSCLQIVIGATGIVGLLLRFIGPLTIAPTITLIGLGLHKSAASKAGQHWGMAVMTIAFVILFSQYLPEVGVPVFSYNSEKKCHVTKLKLFKLFPIILAVAFAWLFCFIFTATDVFPTDSSVYGYGARTDLKSSVLRDSAWFRFPYPGQWGTPTVTLSAVLGIMAGVLASIVESVGDYYACARMSGALPPPQHAINRGVLMEGIGCLLAGAWGSGNGTTSHSANIGVIGLTRVGSRTVVQAAGVMMIITGLIGKISALLITIPEPIVGGVLCITFGMVTAVGLSNLQFVNLNSSRNLFVMGFSTLMGIVIPYYMEENPNLLQTGSAILDQILTVMLTTGMFIGGLLAFLLDNTIAGTDEERGLLVWRQHDTLDEEDKDREIDDEAEEGMNGLHDQENQENMKYKFEVLDSNSHDQRDGKEKVDGSKVPSLQSYDLPWVTPFIRRRARWCRYIPFSPTFDGFKFTWMKKTCKKNS